MSESTWNEVLSDSQRQHLRQFLPQFPDSSIAEQDSTISDLFNNRNFNFGNPLHLAQKLFRGVSHLFTLKTQIMLKDFLRCFVDHLGNYLTADGYFNPEVVKYRQLCAKSQRKRQLYSLQQYYHRLLKQILVSRKVSLSESVLITRIIRTWKTENLCRYVNIFLLKAQGFLQLIVLYLPVAGTAGVCRPQWSGLSPKKKVTFQNAGWNEGAKGEKKIESHIKGGKNWVWGQQRFLWWWRLVFPLFLVTNIIYQSVNITILLFIHVTVAVILHVLTLLLVDISLWTPAPQSPSSPTPTVSLKIFPSLSTQDMRSTGQRILHYWDDVP